MTLIARNLEKRYGDTAALAGVSLTAQPGSTALLGPNGAGKTALLRMLATVARPDRGEISFYGRSYTQDLRAVRRVLGYLPQALVMPEHLTPRGFLHYMAQLKGLAPEPQIAELLAALALEPLADRPLGQLSGGQQRRVALAQALLGTPRLLLLDEPTAGLDPEERERALALINRPVPGRVVLLSSHVPSEVEATARHVVVLRAGRVLFAGTSAELGQMAAGRVFAVTVPAAEVADGLQRWPVSRVTHHGETAVLRIVGAPPAGRAAEPVEGSLEDAYLLLQRTHGA